MSELRDQSNLAGAEIYVEAQDPPSLAADGTCVRTTPCSTSDPNGHNLLQLEQLIKLPDRHDPDARPIATGRLGKPVEFGYKAQVMDNADGVVLDYTVEQGNPADAPQLVPAVERVQHRTGSTPRAVAADRGYGEATVENDLAGLGVRTVAIPRKGKAGVARQHHERGPSFRKLVKWRTGCEGRISYLKHRYGWDRTGIDGIVGVWIWTCHGVLAHNLVKLTVLATARR